MRAFLSTAEVVILRDTSPRGGITLLTKAPNLAKFGTADGFHVTLGYTDRLEEQLQITSLFFDHQ